MSEPVMTPKSVLRDGVKLIGRFVRMHPLAFAIAVTGAAAYAGAIIVSSWVIGWTTDNVIIPILDEGEEPDLLWIAGLAIFAVALFKAVGIVVRRTAAAYLTGATRRDIRNELLAHQLTLKMSWFNRQAIGDLLAVADSDTDQGTGVLGPLPYATGVSLLLVGTVALITSIDPWLGLGAVIGLIVVIVIDVRGSWVTFSMWEAVQKRRGRVASIAHESFDGALTVKALGRENHVAAKFGVASDELRDRIIDVQSTWTKYQVIIRALPQMLIIVLLVVGASRVADGAVTTGDVVTVAYLLTLLAFPIQLIGFVLWDLAGSLAGWRRVQEVLDADESVAFGDTAAIESVSAAPVVGSEVGFAYDDEAVLRDLNLELRAGTTLAVVGPTASGKSTLGLLLARLWDPDSGSISIEGRDLRLFARSELPKEVAYVSQNAFLFDATVRENITLDGSFTEDEVSRALRLAGAADFVNALPHGLDTELGERGTSLSGGQRQRLALARALIRRPRLMILDDATSAVDPSVEADILRALKSAELPSTIVVVAYRPSSIRLADEVVYVDQKRIMAHGTHDELVEREPGYARLVRAYEEEAKRLREAS
ncbi:MAG TPA: ABC transporter ATP-binding protein [Acidimicrobiia bacterium]|nr:ABC transporter ATP-binding protein [Acidimicrobiia bacterium]